MAKKYNILVSGVAPELWPTNTFFALLWYKPDEALEVPKRYPYSGKWGEIISTHLLDEDLFPMPYNIDMVWLSIVERQFYSLEADLPTERMEQLWQQSDPESGEPQFSHIVVGMAPYGQAAVWLRGFNKSVLVSWLQGEPTEVDMADFMPTNPAVTLDENCDFYINNDAYVRENLEQNGLPPRGLFDRMMAQYCYRIVPLFEHWQPNEEEQWRRYADDEERVPEVDHIFISRCDGTHHKIADDSLTRHHTAGRPERIAVAWHAGKSEWTAYLWLDESLTAPLFERFYGTHHDTRMDLMLHFDPEQRHYELAMFRYGLAKPMQIPPECWQIIVFKNQFEHYRSENYDRPTAAWQW